MAKDYEYTRTRIGKEDPWYKPDPADYRQKVGRPGMAGIGDYDDYNPKKTYSQYRQDYKEYKEKKKALKAGTYEYEDSTSGAMEKLRDSGIESDVARAYGSAAGIKVINSLEDARGILNQIGRSQGDYTDQQIKKLRNEMEDDKDKGDSESESQNMTWNEYLENSDTQKATEGFSDSAKAGAQNMLSGAVKRVASDKDTMDRGKAKQGQYVLSNLGSGSYNSNEEGF